MYDDLLAPKGERKYLAFDSSQPSGGKILLFFFLILVSHEPMSQKEKSSAQLDIFSIFSSTQRKCVKREIINNYLLLSQVHGLPAPRKSNYHRSLSAHACASARNLLVASFDARSFVLVADKVSEILAFFSFFSGGGGGGRRPHGLLASRG